MFHDNNFKSSYPLILLPHKTYFPHSPHPPEFWLKGKGNVFMSEQTGTPVLHAQRNVIMSLIILSNPTTHHSASCFSEAEKVLT